MSRSKVEVDKKSLLEHVQDGMTDKEIAEKYLCSESTINRLRKEYGIGRYVFIYNEGEYARMKQVGLSDEEVCFIWGVSRRHLNVWKSRNDLIHKYKQVHKIDNPRGRKFVYKKELFASD